MKKFATALLASASVMVVASAAYALPGDLDTFDGDQFGPSNADIVSNSAGTSTPTGVSRELTAIQTGGGMSGNVSVGINAGGSGLFDVSTSSLAEGVAWIAYDLTSLDLFNDNTINAFAIDIASVDEGATIGVSVGDSEPMALELSNTSSQTFVEGSSGTIYISLSDFTPGDWVSLFVDTRGGLAADILIDTFGTVCFDGIRSECNAPPPSVSEPGTIGLVGLGLIGLAAAARRRG